MAGDPWLGVEMAGYRLDALIGQGGAGMVYRATHLRLGRPAAIKLLAPGLASETEYRRRFEREAQLAARLEHPHIVPIYDAGHTHDMLYLAMRFIEGTTLTAVLDSQGAMPPARVREILGGIADALDHAHRAGLVHRDVKPANILLANPPRTEPDAGKRAYLCDFGIARHTSSNSALTTAGQFLGTLNYCAPEQIQGHTLDGRADQYALACVAFHCLTGQAPYPHNEPTAVMFAHVSAEQPRASTARPALPATLDPVLAKAMAKAPTDRYPDCATFLHALTEAGEGEPGTGLTPTGTAVPGAAVPASTPTGTAEGLPPSGPSTMIWPPGSGRVEYPQPAPTPEKSPTPPPDRRRIVIIGAAVLAVAAVGYLTLRGPSPKISDTPARPISAMVGAIIDLQLSEKQKYHGGIGDVAVSRDGRRLYATTYGEVAVIDTSTNTITARIPTPHALSGHIALTPDGRRAYVTNDHSVTIDKNFNNFTMVTVIDTASNKVIATPSLPCLPTGVVAAPDGRRIYTVCTTKSLTNGSWSIQVIDTASNTVVGAIQGQDDSALDDPVISPDGRTLYTAGRSEVLTVDPAKNDWASSISTPDEPGALAMSPDGRHLYAAAGYFYQHTVKAVWMINTADQSVPILIPVPNLVFDMASTSDWHLYLATPAEPPFNAAVMVLDTVTNSVAKTINLPCTWAVGDEAVAVDPDGRHAYARCDEGSVQVINIQR